MSQLSKSANHFELLLDSLDLQARLDSGSRVVQQLEPEHDSRRPEQGADGMEEASRNSENGDQPVDDQSSGQYRQQLCQDERELSMGLRNKRTASNEFKLHLTTCDINNES